MKITKAKTPKHRRYYGKKKARFSGISPHRNTTEEAFRSRDWQTVRTAASRAEA